MIDPSRYHDLRSAHRVQVLTATHGIVSRAAVLAGMYRGPLYKLLQKYAIEPETFRQANGSLPSQVRRNTE